MKMREIRFRGKRVDNGEWVHGYYAEEFDYVPCIISIKKGPSEGMWFEVDRATVGQFTGLKDKNGKEIFEGDIIGGIFGGTILWCEKCKCFELFLQYHGCTSCEGDMHWQELVEEDGKLEVIGNKWDNPGLLQGTEG